MGFAKYMEDNVEIFNSRMYDRGIDIVELNEFKKSRKKKPYSASIKEEYFLILDQIEKLEELLAIIENAKKIIKTESTFQTMDNQQKYFSKVRDEYIDYKFDPKFRAFKNRKHNIPETELRKYRKTILKNYIRYFIDSLKKMENFTDNDAIEINFMYWDMESFVEQFLSIKIKSLQIPLVQHLRENILNHSEVAWILCTNCRGKTYKDFKTCILCKYPNEVV